MQGVYSNASQGDAEGIWFAADGGFGYGDWGRGTCGRADAWAYRDDHNSLPPAVGREYLSLT
jgi:hypothetical protein